MRIAVIGDLMLDVLVEPDGPLRPGDDTPGRIRMQSGGQAANVAAWVAALGGQARLVCARADDDGRAAAGLQTSGRGEPSSTSGRTTFPAPPPAADRSSVEVVGPCLPGRGGVVVSIISGAGERTLVSDPGCAHSLRPEHLDGEWFADCAWLHVSGYHLFDEHAAPAALRAAELAREHGARISLDLSCAARLRELGRDEATRRIRALGPDLVFQTAEEAEALGRADERDVLGCPRSAVVWVEKRGPAGCVVVSGGERLALPASGGRVVDTTGAGDAFAAGFLIAAADFRLAPDDFPLTTNDLRSAAFGGLATAARCVATVGAMPAPDSTAPVEMGSR